MLNYADEIQKIFRIRKVKWHSLHNLGTMTGYGTYTIKSSRESNDEVERAPKRIKRVLKQGQGVLDEVDLKKLDIDRERVCSITLSPLNVYACLKCGKFLQGRKENSVAFQHSIQEDHHAFMNLHTGKAYILPENYQLGDNPLLERIRLFIAPSYTPQQISELPVQCFDIFNNAYWTGLVRLNDNNNSSHITVALQLIARIPPIRDFLLLTASDKFEDELLNRLSLLIKRIWSSHLLKCHLSPHEILHHLSLTNSSLLTPKNTPEPKDIFLWIINRLFGAAPAMKKLLSKEMRGELFSLTQEVPRHDNQQEDTKSLENSHTTRRKIKFWTLTLDLPPMPLFKDGFDTNSIPQVRLEDLLTKFNGVEKAQTKQGTIALSLSKLPRLLILHINRFNRAVECPIKNRNQTIVKLPSILKVKGSKFKLIAIISHKGVRGTYSDETELDQESQWSIIVYEKSLEEWFEVNDKSITIKEKELLFLEESCIQVWEAME
ncbi:LADA_0A07228g1_1 [Lachancea dasiensis]|uniref:LADA_0A07228g1_1 n=1 Tax=Lachancea dasiensis TaxID=1072105 RepID=A0A1G4IPV9_9SACH|nr:LADA_0A07228g1_1 [Lachancea dasiensis]